MATSKLQIRSPNMVKPQLPMQRPNLLIHTPKINVWSNEDFVLGFVVGILGLILLELFILLLYGLFGALVSLI